MIVQIQILLILAIVMLISWLIFTARSAHVAFLNPIIQEESENG
jgi:hypothetical protein